MSNLEALLSEIKSRADKATEGPWCDWYGALCIDVSPKEYFDLVGPNIEQGPPFRLPKKKQNMDFIVSSRTDVPRLVAALEFVNNRLKSHYKDARDLKQRNLFKEIEFTMERTETILKGAGSDG